jgi:hypothetical protein
MVTLEEQDVAIEPSGDLQAMVNQPQYERVELTTRWSQRKEFTCGRKVEDVKEDLVPSSVRACAGESVLCGKARLTSFGRAKIPLLFPWMSAIVIYSIHRTIF